MSNNELVIPFVYAGEVLAAAIVLPLICITTVGLRFWLRSVQDWRIGRDDWTILAALFPVMGMGICLIYGTAKGAIGYPSTPYPTPLNPPILEELTETTPEQTIIFTMDWIIWVLMIPGNGLIKLSALFLYQRLFVVSKNSAIDIAIKFMLVVCSVWTLGFWLAQIFGCGANFSAPFGNLLAVASCNTNVRLDALMVSDLITDILVWILPIPVVWQLNMSIAKKLSVTGILSLAAVSLAAAIVRLIVQEEISGGGYAAHTDVNLTLTILLYWSMIESSLALIAACLPTLHHLVAHSSIRSATNSMRRLLSTLTSNKSFSTLDDGHQSKTSASRSRRPRADGESYELSRDGYKASDVEKESAEFGLVSGRGDEVGTGKV